MRLYNSNETDFLHNGLGLLSDAISSVAIDELNGMFELKMEYDSEGFLADVIKEEMIIKAKANDKQDEQLFRIYSITKNHENDNLIIDAQHITYDLGNNFVEELEARSMTKRQVMELIGSSTNYEHPFNVTSSNNTTRSSTSLYRTNPLQMIGGMEGSVLQIWGGQIERDNFNLIMHDRRGSDDGVKVLYKKNLTGLNAKFDIENLKTRIFPFVFIPATDDEPEQLITVPGKYIDSPYIDDYEMPYILPVDYSYEDGIETSQDLLNIASNWFNETGRDKPKVEMNVRFEHLWETEEYEDVAALELVGMGDTITVNHSKLKVEGTAIVNRIEYDVIARKNIAVDVGHVKARFTDKVNDVGNVIERVEQAEQSANQAIRTANGKNTIYYGPDEPTGNHSDGDLWFRVVDGEYTRTYRFDGIQWQLVVSKDVKDVEEVANTAHNRADEAVANASLATQNATEAINQAQTAFDEAQEALTTAQGLTNRMTSVEGDISTLSQTTQSFATRIENNEGDISTLTQTAQGLQNRVADAEGNISSVTQLAEGMQTRLTDAEGNINTLTQTATSLESTISNVRDDLDGLEIGEINLIPKSDQKVTSTGYLVKEYFINEDFITGDTYTAVIKGSINTGQEFGLWQNTGSNSRGRFKDLGNGIFILTFDSVSTTSGNERKIRIYNYPSSGASSATIEWIKFVRANKTSLSWSPAPEDLATQSQITQLSDNINARVEKGDVINQINISTEDILISGKKLILDGDTTVTGTFRVKDANITSVDAGKMTTGALDAGLVNVINLNADNITSGTIDTTLLTVRGGSATDYTMIQGSYFESRGRFNRAWRGSTATHDIRLRFQNGYLRARNDTENRSLYFSDYGISTAVDGSLNDSASGTLQFFDTQYSTARGVTLHSHFGVVALQSNDNRVVISPQVTARSGTNDFSFRVKDNSWENSDGWISFGDTSTSTYHSGLRFSKNSRAYTIYATDGEGNIGTGNFHANNFIGDLEARGTHAYALVDDRLRVTDRRGYNNGNPNYMGLQAHELLANSLRVNSGNLYLGTSDGEARITNNLLYNGGNVGYRPIRAFKYYAESQDSFVGVNGARVIAESGAATLRSDRGQVYLQGTEAIVVAPGTTTQYRQILASDFIPSSSEQWKTDIKKYEGSALDLFRQSVIYQYYKHDSADLEYGFITERETPHEIKRGEGISSYSLQGLTIRSIQELDTKVDETREDILLKIAELESRLNKLEVVA